MSNATLNEYDLVASICRDSFYDFVKEFWSFAVTAKPIWNWHIKYLCDELQYVAELVFANKPKEYNLIINISPGSTKSTICSVMLLPWCWTRMQEIQYIGGSYSMIPISTDFGTKSRDIIWSDKYRACFPEIEIRRDQSGKTFYKNKIGGWRFATSTEGSATGMHAHIIVVDDPLDPREAVSEVTLKTANDWISDTLSQRKVDQALTPIILIMQRLHQNDPTAHLIEMGKEAQREAIRFGNEDAPLKVKHICLPAEKTDKVKPRKLRRFYKDGLMDPIRLGREVLAEKMTVGDYTYSSQFLQSPVPRGGGMFKTDRIEIDVAPTKWKKRIRFWDKAGTQGGKGAYTVGLLMGLDRKDRYWILDVLRGRWSSEVREATIKQTAQIDGVEVMVGIEQEPGSGGKESMENTVRNLRGFIVRVDKPSG